MKPIFYVVTVFLLLASGAQASSEFPPQPKYPSADFKLDGYAFRSTSFSPDGKKFATADKDGLVYIWDTDSGKKLQTLEAHGGLVYVALFFPDGKRMITGGKDRNVKIWDTESGKMLRVLNKEYINHASSYAGIVTAGFSPDGKKLVTGDQAGVARIWDVESGAMLHVLKEDSMVFSAAFSPDGKRIVTCSNGYTIRVWDTDSGIELKTISTGYLNNGVRYAAFSSDGEKIVAHTGGHGTALVFDANLGIELRRWKYHYCVDFSPDGDKVVMRGTDDIVRIWDTDSGKELKKLEEKRIRSVAFSSDGKRIATLADFALRIWDAESGEELKELARLSGGIMNPATFSRNGKKVSADNGQGKVSIWILEKKSDAE